METSTMITIIICAIVGCVLVWAVFNANNFKKSAKKKKDKPEKKFKDVAPKEKAEKPPKKEKKPVVNKISDRVKDEKAGKVNPPSNKVVKVTKEDFESNDIVLPDNGTKKEEPKKEDSKKTNTKDQDFNLDDFDLEKELARLGLGTNDVDLGGLAIPDIADTKPNFNTSGADNGVATRYENPEDLKDLDYLFGYPPVKKPEGKIENEELNTRIKKVFGDLDYEGAGAVKEVIIGDILATNRSKENRKKRKYWK